ncbi:MAG: dockerin type I repeat-containing protein [Phycisphaerales bacterium]|nr:dockerin type I repeat-containing protein [Phycisphaerales bacterium]
MKRAMSLFAAVGVAFAGAASANDLVIGNFGAGIGTGTIFGVSTTSNFKAFGFTMGSESYTLDRVLLSMYDVTPTIEPFVSIWSGEFQPVAEIVLLDNPAFTFDGEYEFTTSSNIVLEAGESYWIHVRPIALATGERFGWDGTSPSTMPSGPAASAIGFNFNGNSSSFFNRLEVRGSPGGPVCVPDLNGDGVVDADDFFLFLQLFAAGDTRADMNGDGIIDADDFFMFLNLFAAGC